MSEKTRARRSLPHFFTIGAYGSNSDSFFKALQDAAIDTFCDLRARRGVRGSEYAFVNSKRLQARLDGLEIRYLHLPELAPSKEIRSRQAAIDEASHVAKRKRSELSSAFRIGYMETVLKGFSSADFLCDFADDATRIVLFCVEREASACHRSLLAERLERDLGITVTHLLP